jgi:hypothetical protein
MLLEYFTIVVRPGLGSIGRRHGADTWLNEGLDCVGFVLFKLSFYMLRLVGEVLLLLKSLT